MHPEDFIRDYYESLRRGDPLAPYFLEAETTVKFGIGESLFGGEAVADGLREQTETTDGWSVESRRLTVGEREGYAWFADEVALAWTDRESGERNRFDTRWSGALERRERGSDPEWAFASMHVSTAEAVP
ncbi:nuclear transport factor 2 family protein [Natrononativus amylolyticus]|uniref:nuclear transport factor 2 family protein n=1 Tax=Natrononativus amylolyticus TaxID=2963434 RepID=UPI0020CF2B39|nr:nuclear transport factor 2 family protein [Natrononativus amylolyticus]